MNRFFELIFAVAVLFGSTLAGVADEAAFHPEDEGTFFKRPLVATALFTQSEAESTLPNRVVSSEHTEPFSDNTLVAQATAQQTVVSGHDLSFLDQSRRESEPVSSTDQASTLLWQLAAILAFAVVVGAVVLIKKAPHRVALADPGQLAVVGTLPLSHRSVVHLIAVGDSRLVVASDASGVKSVVPISEPFRNLLNTELEPAEAPHV